MCIHLSARLFAFETCDGMRRTAGCVCVCSHFIIHITAIAPEIKFTPSKQEMHSWHFSHLLCFCFYFWKLICHKMFEPLTKRLFKKFHQSIHFESCKHSVTRTWLSCVLESTVCLCVDICWEIMWSRLYSVHVLTLLSERLICHWGTLGLLSLNIMYLNKYLPFYYYISQELICLCQTSGGIQGSNAEDVTVVSSLKCMTYMFVCALVQTLWCAAC